jgi:dUTP pyrophosphatase
MSDASSMPDAKKRKVDDEHSSLAPVSGLLVKRLSEKARLPTRGSALAAGYDLYRWVHNVCFELPD